MCQNVEVAEDGDSSFRNAETCPNDQTCLQRFRLHHHGTQNSGPTHLMSQEHQDVDSTSKSETKLTVGTGALQRGDTWKEIRNIDASMQMK